MHGFAYSRERIRYSISVGRCELLYHRPCAVARHRALRDRASSHTKYAPVRRRARRKPRGGGAGSPTLVGAAAPYAPAKARRSRGGRWRVGRSECPKGLVGRPDKADVVMAIGGGRRSRSSAFLVPPPRRCAAVQTLPSASAYPTPNHCPGPVLFRPFLDEVFNPAIEPG